MAKRKSQASQRKPTKMELSWKRGCRFSESKVPVETAYAEICKIKEQNGGEVTAEDLVLYGQDHPRSVMHKLIGMDDGWDDKSAAHRYRVMRAGTILRAIDVKYVEDQKEPVRAFNIDSSGWQKKQSRYKPYRATADILKDETARSSLLQSALNELISFQRRYRSLNELAVLMRGIDSFMDDFHAANA